MNFQGGRKFHDEFPTKEDVLIGEEEKPTHLSKDEETKKTYEFINDNIIGKDLIFNGPFGKRNVIHCDYTASGRSLKYIEDYIQDVALPHYGNTHTTTSVTSLQTTMFRDEARNVIRKAVNASERDAVIFTGSGCTSAVHKLIHALKFQAPPIVFVSPFEHHSNLLPWKEIGGKIVWTSVTQDGGVDLNHLEINLKEYQNCGRPLIGCFSAASNITGMLVDTDVVAALMHKYNCLAFFDYATAGPYVDINMNPSNVSDSHLTHKDAVFLSPHKFVGGPGTPGILIAKKHLFVNPVPAGGGGGSVFYVTANTHRYLKEIEVREEGGTPDLIGSIRAGLVFQLKENVRCENIIQRDKELLRYFEETCGKSENLIVLGKNSEYKLPIFSFVIKHPESGRLLHHNFVSVLLNDLFGIQSRGGCACAGPYAQELLGMSEDVALQIEDLLLEDQRLDRHHLRRHREYSDKEILRPGFTRINLPFFYDDKLIHFILKAVSLVADHGWKLLPEYLLNPETGEWRYRNFQIYKDRKWIGSLKYKNGSIIPPEHSSENYQYSIKDILHKAEDLLLGIKKGRNTCIDQTILFGEQGEKLRWFLLPCEAQEYLNNSVPDSCKSFTMPFFPQESLVVKSNYKKVQSSHFSSTHYCTCSPLHMDFIKLRNPPNESVMTSQNDFLSNGHTENQYENGEHLYGNGDGRDIVENRNGHMNGEHDLCNGENEQSYVRHLLNGNDYLDTYNNFNNGVASPGGKNQRIDDDKQTSDHNFKQTESTKKLLISCSLKAAGKKNGNVEIGTKNVVKFHNPPKVLFSSVVEAIHDFNMIQNNDRVLLCLSGGKDSLSMLHIIHQFKFYAKKKNISFQFGAVTVDPQSAGYDPSPLKHYLKLLDVPYFFEEQDIIGAASELSECESICSYCSRMKRGRIYACARREGYNVVALGQHLDDIAESFLMSTFHNGYLRSMKANYHVREEDIRVIRPLIYVREKDLRSFAEKVKLPVIPENCPACFEAPKERHRMKQLLAQQEVLFPNLFKSLRTALHPLIAKSRTGLERRVVQDDEE